MKTSIIKKEKEINCKFGSYLFFFLNVLLFLSFFVFSFILHLCPFLFLLHSLLTIYCTLLRYRFVSISFNLSLVFVSFFFRLDYLLYRHISYFFLYRLLLWFIIFIDFSLLLVVLFSNLYSSLTFMFRWHFLMLFNFFHSILNFIILSSL